MWRQSYENSSSYKDPIDFFPLLTAKTKYKGERDFHSFFPSSSAANMTRGNTEKSRSRCSRLLIYRFFMWSSVSHSLAPLISSGEHSSVCQYHEPLFRSEQILEGRKALRLKLDMQWLISDSVQIDFDIRIPKLIIHMLYFKTIIRFQLITRGWDIKNTLFCHDSIME